MNKEAGRCRLERFGLSNCVRRSPGVEGSIARARVGAHWPLENLIIEKTLIVVTLTLDGETQIHDVMPTQFSGN